jgi:uncharacterized protein YbbC (DUF1343 family)
MARRILHFTLAAAVALLAASITLSPIDRMVGAQEPSITGPIHQPVATPGANALAADPSILRGKRLGLVTHQAGIIADGRLSSIALSEVPGINITALFAPEHGIDGTLDASETVPTIAGRTPVYSLYGASFQPTREMLSRVDVLAIDLQDVGVRPFTYASTMSNVMTAAREAGKPVVILDRPNPMGGLTVDGPVLETWLRSFIGMHAIPYVHGMTIGELAYLYNRGFGIGANLTVVRMQGWKRAMRWADTGLPWVNPSPGITAPDAAFHYAATGPVDGTNLWNGVATESRFQVVLAKGWIDGQVLADALNAYNLPGVRFSASAIPHPRTYEVWRGVRFHVTDPATFKPSTTMIYVLAEIRRLYGAQLIFRKPGRGPYLFDLVWGTADVRLALSKGQSASAIVARWQPALERFKRLRQAHLLYD